MAEFNNGANGSFSGKVGSVVGSNWREINYIRGIAKRSKKDPSQGQIEQQMKFAMMVAFLGQVKDLLNLGFAGGKTGRATAYNLAVQYNLTNAIAGVYPEFSIDYSKVLLSKGTLNLPGAATLTADTAGQVSASWDPTPNEFNGSVSDKVTVILYNSIKKLFMSNSLSPALRGDGTIDIEVPATYAGDTLHGYIFLTSPEKGRLSNSYYMGEVTVL
ncbi:DUF6266 family protein [Desertivirga brevis]|uniref:DUF6266 family protein n=1 Tax=Desertivirga brevis TaxID=2810310 RepID=UPI001A97CDB7|nr:DUF6266 family protein [Pedobacter sp. SYSU D00873]